jgi:hypothetical protein
VIRKPPVLLLPLLAACGCARVDVVALIEHTPDAGDQTARFGWDAGSVDCTASDAGIPFGTLGPTIIFSPSLVGLTVHSGTERFVGHAEAPPCQRIRGPITVSILGGPNGVSVGVASREVPTPVSTVELDLPVDTTQFANGDNYCFNLSITYERWSSALSLCAQVIRN